jgi:hypothetical protein
MTDRRYVAQLHRHLADYKATVLGVAESGDWGKPPRPYSHILPTERRELNIVTSLRERFWREQNRWGWRLHKNFHHLSSSQALAFNLFFSAYPEVPLRMATTRRALSLQADVPCRVDFEAVLDGREGTNVDVLMSAADGRRTIIEIKLTERSFGTAAPDARHLAKLNDIYKPLLAGRVADSCLTPPSFFRDFQLYRNVAQVRRESLDRVLLLLPRARTQLWQHAVAWCQAPTLGSLSDCIKVVAVEDVIAAIAEDAVDCDEDAQVIAEVCQKYIPR